jgi:hypothetical protein
VQHECASSRQIKTASSIYSFLFVINFTTKKSDEGEAESVSSSSQRHTHQEIYRGLLAIVRAPPATTRLDPKKAVFHTCYLLHG